MITAQAINNICEIYFTDKFVLLESVSGFTVQANKDGYTVSCYFDKSKTQNDSYIEIIEDMIYGMVKTYDL